MEWLSTRVGVGQESFSEVVQAPGAVGPGSAGGVAMLRGKGAGSLPASPNPGVFKLRGGQTPCGFHFCALHLPQSQIELPGPLKTLRKSVLLKPRCGLETEMGVGERMEEEL